MSQRSWRDYQAVARELLNRFAKDFGLDRVEEAQSVPGRRSSTNWALDAKGVMEDGEGIIVVECRQYRSKRQVQEQVAALAYRVLDTGARGAIIVSPLDLQAGAKKVAAAENVISVQLDADSTPDEFAMRFLNRLYVGIVERAHATDTCSATVTRVCEACGVRFEPQGQERRCQACHNAA